MLDFGDHDPVNKTSTASFDEHVEVGEIGLYQHIHNGACRVRSSRPLIYLPRLVSGWKDNDVEDAARVCSTLERSLDRTRFIYLN